MPANLPLGKVVEKQMRNWELSRQQRPDVDQQRDERDVEDFVAISRAIAAGGRRVAEALAERLGWPLFDREILQHMAEDNALRERIYDHMDERDTSWVESVLRWLLQGELRKEDYHHRLVETALALARQGHGIFLGRGLDLVLPEHRGLRVRITAPEIMRVRTYAQRKQCSEKEAREKLEFIRRERREFIRHVLRRDPEDEARFDLVVNLRRLSLDDTVELIMVAMRQRGMLVE